MSNIFARKSIALLQAEAQETEVQALVTHGGVPLKRTLTATSLLALGIGAIIGAGIFVLTGPRRGGERRTGDRPLVRPRRHRLRLRGALLRRDGLHRSDLPAAPTPTPMRPWASSSPGSSAGT